MRALEAKKTHAAQGWGGRVLGHRAQSAPLPFASPPRTKATRTASSSSRERAQGRSKLGDLPLMLVVLGDAQGLPERVELPDRLTHWSEVWALRLAVEREISGHDRDLLIDARGLKEVSELVLGWWVLLRNRLATMGRSLVITGLRPDFEAAMESIAALRIASPEVPQRAPDRGLAEAELTSQSTSFSTHQEPAAPTRSATVLPFKA